MGVLPFPHSVGVFSLSHPPPPMLMPAGRVGVTGSVWVEGFKSQACRFGNRVFPSYLSSRNDREIGAFPRLVQALF